MSRFPHPDESRIAENYDRLKELGISLTEHYCVDDLVQVMKKQNREDVMGMLSIMGGTYGEMPFFHLSDDVWEFDMTVIEDPQAYSDFATRLSTLTRSDVKLENISSDLSPARGEAWIEFDFQNRHYHWDFVYRDEYVDPKFFKNFLGLIADSSSKKSLAMSNHGTTAILVYTTEWGLAELRSLTDRDWDWITLHEKPL